METSDDHESTERIHELERRYDELEKRFTGKHEATTATQKEDMIGEATPTKTQREEVAAE